jgi:23S rRNA pseudouridine1911/1915/1917 synthase
LARSEEPFQIFQPTEDIIGKTLAAAIKEKLKCKSWGEARKVVAQRRIQLNGNLCLDPARRLTEKDVLKVWQEPLPKPVDQAAVRFVHIDEDLLIVEKPPRITSARHYEERAMKTRRRQLQPTFEELIPIALATYIRKQRAVEKKLGRVPTEAEILSHTYRDMAREEEFVKQFSYKLKVIAVHRLDRDTSGLMIFARNQRTAERLGKLFRTHAIDRRYNAVIIGHMGQLTLESHLIRDRGDGHRGSATDPIPEDAQHAITHVRPVEQIGKYTIVECKLETGRTHQIRIHLAEAGHPLCGETIYNRTSDGKTIEDKSRAPRQALHSSALRFVHPTTGMILKFSSPWPPDLDKWLQNLRKS